MPKSTLDWGVKEEWGQKRTCSNCYKRFYDLKKSPWVCPYCQTSAEKVAKRKVIPVDEAILEPSSEIHEELGDFPEAAVEEFDSDLEIDMDIDIDQEDEETEKIEQE